MTLLPTCIPIITPRDIRSATKPAILVALFVGSLTGFAISSLYLQVNLKYPGEVAKRIEYSDKAVENTDLALKLFDKVRVLCWVMTHPANHKAKARHVKRTWGRRCNVLLFISSEDDPELPTISFPTNETHDHMWPKNVGALKYIHEHHLKEVDWFFKADDDTYAIMENLRFMLYGYNTEDPLYFGFKFRPLADNGYMSGGAGFVMSREALRRLVVEAFPNPELCDTKCFSADDVMIGRCLGKVNVFAGDSRDAHFHGRFFALQPVDHLGTDQIVEDYWYWKNSYYFTKEGVDDCSDNAITFHYIDPRQMYVLDYLIYRLQPYGRIVQPQSLPRKQTVQELIDAKATQDLLTPKPGRYYVDDVYEMLEKREELLWGYEKD